MDVKEGGDSNVVGTVADGELKQGVRRNSWKLMWKLMAWSLLFM